MPTTKLTRRGLAGLTPADKRVVYYDEDLAGFAMRVESTGRMTYFVEYRPGAGGRGVAKKRLTLGTTAELKPEEARERAKTFLAQVRLGSDPAMAKAKAKRVPTFAKYAAEHLDAMDEIAQKHPEQATLRPGSIRNYRSLLKRHVGPAIGSCQLDAISRDEIKRLHTRIGKTSPTTANRCLEFIGSIYKAADHAGHVEEGTNPARSIKAYKERKRERYLTPLELARLGEAIRIAETTGIPYDPPSRPGKKAKHVPKNVPPTIIDQYTAAALRLLIFSGARLREILHAKWADVDMSRGLLTVFSKTGRRHIVLPAPALEILVGLPRTNSPYVIRSSVPDQPRADLNRPWRGIRRMAGLPDLRIHDLRHSFASVAVSGGASLPMIGALLGHASPTTTQRYAHLAADPVRAAAEAAAGAIAGAMSGTKGKITLIRKGAEDAA
ncbi:Site-specific recombinase XerD [Filomicrobium insigne]|uniref:Site-specific recombinase XerD n=1 Tax=Filomicrobium insigne TaxID=418854 RepID=A0A1H0N3X5_9HYPH|nr:site-specific integrase [Filomicrobium insigne]SDO87377.1 Site-specific recombinase XerD [Filomicrobium insigne]